MLNISFYRAAEMHIGSTNFFGYVRITATETGEWVPSIRDFYYADEIVAKDAEGRIALSRFDGSNAIGLAFRLVLIDPKQRKVFISRQIKGAVKSLEILAGNCVRVELDTYVIEHEPMVVEVEEELRENEKPTVWED